MPIAGFLVHVLLTLCHYVISIFAGQIKLVGGSAKTLTLEATDTLQDVLRQLDMPDVRLMTTFPKRIFTSADVGKTLKDLGT